MGVFSFLAKLFQDSEPATVVTEKPQPQPQPIAVPTQVKSTIIREKVEAERERQFWNDVDRLAAILQDYSGFFRQAAVERCEELRLPGTLSLVASRLNDWVPQVRESARKAVLAMLDGASLEDQLAALEIVGVLHRAGRADHSKWISEFELKLLAVVGTGALWDALVRGPRKRARICFELLLKQAVFPLERLLDHGVASKGDIVLATQCVNLAIQLRDPERLLVLKGAMTSHFGHVRKAALQALLAQGEGENLAREFLFDKHATVRALAIGYLEQHQFDVKHYYRAVLPTLSVQPARLKIVLLSLASLGSVEDLATIKEYTGAANPGVRFAAYASWLRLAPSEKDALTRYAFADSSPSVRKFARFMLERHGAYVTFPDLAKLIGSSEELLRLMFTVHSHKWNWLEAIAMVANEVPLNSPLAAGLAAELRRWISNAKWARHRPIGNQAIELSDPMTVQNLERLILGETGAIAQLREQIAQASST